MGAVTWFNNLVRFFNENGEGLLHAIDAANATDNPVEKAILSNSLRMFQLEILQGFVDAYENHETVIELDKASPQAREALRRAYINSRNTLKQNS